MSPSSAAAAPSDEDRYGGFSRFELELEVRSGPPTSSLPSMPSRTLALNNKAPLEHDSVSRRTKT